MADSTTPPPSAPVPQQGLEQGTYEILRSRLTAQGSELRARLERLNVSRQEVFGTIKTGLIATERITTKNNCLPRDLIPIGGGRFLFGYNVHLGLRTETHFDDVFAVYEYRDKQFHVLPLDVLGDPQFESDFKSLYRYYKNTVFTKFTLLRPSLFMEFRVGQSVGISRPSSGWSATSPRAGSPTWATGSITNMPCRPSTNSNGAGPIANCIARACIRIFRSKTVFSSSAAAAI